jgi:hypothetical protein
MFSGLSDLKEDFERMALDSARLREQKSVLEDELVGLRETVLRAPLKASSDLDVLEAIKKERLDELGVLERQCAMLKMECLSNRSGLLPSTGCSREVMTPLDVDGSAPPADELEVQQRMRNVVMREGLVRESEGRLRRVVTSLQEKHREMHALQVEAKSLQVDREEIMAQQTALAEQRKAVREMGDQCNASLVRSRHAECRILAADEAEGRVAVILCQALESREAASRALREAHALLRSVQLREVEVSDMMAARDRVKELCATSDDRVRRVAQSRAVSETVSGSGGRLEPVDRLERAIFGLSSLLKHSS